MTPPPIIAASVENLLFVFSKLTRDNKDRITLALQRLLRSRGQLHPGNRAIDGCGVSRFIEFRDHRQRIARLQDLPLRSQHPYVFLIVTASLCVA